MVAVGTPTSLSQSKRGRHRRHQTREELGKRSSIERFFGRVFLFFHLQPPPLTGWSEIVSQVALTYPASVIVGLAAQQAGRPDLIRSPSTLHSTVSLLLFFLKNLLHRTDGTLETIQPKILAFPCPSRIARYAILSICWQK